MISSQYIQTAMQDWNVPGLSIAVVKDGKDLMTAGFGQSHVDRPSTVNERTLFTIGSCTKAFATTALAILVEEKLLSWEDPLRKFIPGFSLPSDTEGSDLTLAEIVSHQSGVEDGAISDLPCRTLEEALAHLSQIKPQGKRGIGMTYNNTLFAALAVVIEKTTGLPWSDFMHERIFLPLGMGDSFSMDKDSHKVEEHRRNLTSPHQKIWQTQQTVVMKVKSLDYLAASAAVQTCAADMAKWLNFQLGFQPNILNAQALKQMHRLKYHVEANQFTLMMHPGSSVHGYGKAWYVRDYRGKTLVQHGGYVDGFTAFNLLCPETNLGVAVLTNMHNSLLPFALAYRVVDTDFGQPEFDWSGHFLHKRAEHRRMVSPHAEENARIAKDY